MRKFIPPRWKGGRERRRGGPESERKRENGVGKKKREKCTRRNDESTCLQMFDAWPRRRDGRKKMPISTSSIFPGALPPTLPAPGNLNCGLHANEIFPVRVRWPRLYLSAPFSLAKRFSAFARMRDVTCNVDARYFLRPPRFLAYFIYLLIFFFFIYATRLSRPNLWQISGLPGNFNPREICLVKIFARNINANFASRVIPHCKPNKRHRFRNRMLRCNDHSQRFYVSIDFRIKIQFLRSIYLSLNFIYFFFWSSNKLNSWRNSFQSSDLWMP